MLDSFLGPWELTALYVAWQFITFVAYVLVGYSHTVIRHRSWVAYSLFIITCGFHHLGCITGLIDMPGHMPMHYSGGWGFLRFSFDTLMVMYSTYTAVDWVVYKDGA